ncbi:MAG TPA: hypothetical protein VMU04_24725 [Candidatus Acidoferrum sp.]|nr:hypothetical protein [Candidatus Acidoferrum sp.]
MSMSWGPDPEKLKAANAKFPRVNPTNPTELSDAEWAERVVRDREGWNKIKGEIQKQFEEVIHAAMPSSDWARSGRQPREVEAMFARRLKQMLYVPRLPSGGADEARIAMRLGRLASKLGSNGSSRLPLTARGRLRMLSGRYRELTGRYYNFRPLPEGKRPEWEKAQKEASAADDVELWRACEVVLKGTPEPITDFVVEPLYVLVRVNGTRERIVRIRNVHGEVTELLHWPAEELATPKAMRIWLNNNSNCANWEAGERELNRLGMDIGQAVNDRTVYEVPLRGQHYPSGIWFYADGALLNGKALYQDKNGIYWHNGKGYLPGDKDQEGEFFRMGPRPGVPGPLMHPVVEVSRDTAKEIFAKFAQDIHDAVGGYAGWLALGAVLAFFVAREIFDRYTGVPGLWTSGEPGQGKTSINRWLVRIHGFLVKQGVPIPGATAAALRGAMQQYGDLPLWLDEFQARAEVWVTDIAKAAYERGGAPKRTFGDQPREVRTPLMISGVATSTDAQLRSRYVHVHVAAANRLNFNDDRYREVETFADRELYKMGRFILANREEFARLVMGQIGFWTKDPKLANCDDRSRIVHGAAYSAFVALASMLETHGAEQFAQFKESVRGHVEGAQADVRDQLYVTLYFEHLLNAVKQEGFGDTISRLKEYFKVVDKPEDLKSPPVSEHQRQKGQESAFCAWRSKLLYIQAQGSVEVVMAYRRRLGITENLSRKDLQEQMKGRPWFVPPPGKRSAHQVRFQSGGQEVAWCIDVDRHEMGRLEVSDEDFDASLRREDGNWKTGLHEWADPRKGPLYSLIELLERQPKEG